MTNMTYNGNILLWLDDCRDPFENPDWLVFSPIPRTSIDTVIWVKDYHTFVEWINNNGLPSAICFDHDLGDDPENGFTCAKWLVDYCLDNDLPLPKYNIQSANPVGKENIDGLLKQYNKFYNEKQAE